MIDKNILNKHIKRFLELRLGRHLVPTPYFINYLRKKDLRVMVGKGTPDEIETEFKIWAKVKNFKYENAEISEIRNFLCEVGIGIDCSGFVVHVLNEYLKEVKNKSIWKLFRLPKDYPIYLRIGYLLRPAEKLGVKIITSDDNSYMVQLKDVSELDLIKSTAKKNNSEH
ncbi:MAG: hypothetical protein NZZ41_06310, partial [Candidatus Dojkabacteria bacterium]|nr:hypothetical protein [Candidatus Dojkabacteria bacterium]